MLNFSLANVKDLDIIDALYSDVKTDLLSKGIFQWDDFFPNRDYIENAIKFQCLYVLRDEEDIVASVIITEYQEPSWENIDWSNKSGNNLVLQALAVHPDHQNKGHGSSVIGFCEGLALSYEYNGIRFDAFPENSESIKLFEKLGYINRGEVYYSFKPEGHQRYLCFEKNLEF